MSLQSACKVSQYLPLALAIYVALGATTLLDAISLFNTTESNSFTSLISHVSNPLDSLGLMISPISNFIFSFSTLIISLDSYTISSGNTVPQSNSSSPE